MSHLRRLTWSGVTCLFLTASVAVTAQKPERDAKFKDPDSRRPKVTLKAQPLVSMSPARVVLTAELQGGADDYEEFYCPSIEWDWGDGTVSEAQSDCEPYAAGTSKIQRRWSSEHIYRQSGGYKIVFRLKQKTKAIAIGSANVQVRAGMREGFGGW
jgi:hypothetical protein